ncbi:MAG: rhodanese-like domain-containing protein [Longimicrobiales bacterium]
MNRPEEAPEITPVALKKRLDDGEVPRLLDVREPFEQRIADLPEVGQHRIPTSDILARMDELDPAEELVVYCRSGGRSAWAARILLDRGFQNVLNLKGGVLGWREDVDPSLDSY